MTLNVQERTWKVEVLCEFGTVPAMVIHRELIHTDANGVVILRDRNLPVVRRTADMQTIIDDPKSNKLFNLIDTKADDWADEDAAVVLTPPPA